MAESRDSAERCFAFFHTRLEPEARLSGVIDFVPILPFGLNAELYFFALCFENNEWELN